MILRRDICKMVFDFNLCIMIFFDMLLLMFKKYRWGVLIIIFVELNRKGEICLKVSFFNDWECIWNIFLLLLVMIIFKYFSMGEYKISVLKVVLLGNLIYFKCIVFRLGKEINLVLDKVIWKSFKYISVL